MKWDVEFSPAYSLLKVLLEPGEFVVAEPGAMVYMKGDIDIITSTGGILKGFLRAILGGESVFLNKYVAQSRAEIWFAPRVPGDIKYVEITPQRPLIIQDTSYLAHHGNINLTVAWKGLRGVIAEGEFFWLKAEGNGGVWINSYGGIKEIELKPGEKIIVDNFHFVAMDDGMKWEVKTFGKSIKSFIFGGEGLVIEIEGPGRVYVQTRCLPPFVDIIARFLRTK